VLNSIILIGRLTADPDLRYTKNGNAFCRFSLAVDRPYKSDSEQQVDFIDIVTWRLLADNCAKHLSKGRLVAVRGRLQINNYEASDGSKRRTAQVVADDVRFLDRPSAARTEATTSSPPEDDDLPF